MAWLRYHQPLENAKMQKYTDLHAVQLHFIQCPFPNRFQFGSEKNPKKFENFFRTDSSSVRHFWYGFFDNFSEPIPIRFGIFGMDLLITFPNRFQFGSEKWYLHLSKKFPNKYFYVSKKTLFDHIFCFWQYFTIFDIYLYIFSTFFYDHQAQ